MVFGHFLVVPWRRKRLGGRGPVVERSLCNSEAGCSIPTVVLGSRASRVFPSGTVMISQPEKNWTNQDILLMWRSEGSPDNDVPVGLHTIRSEIQIQIRYDSVG